MRISRVAAPGLLLALLAPACAGRSSPGAAFAATAKAGDQAAASTDKAAVAGPLRFIADDAPAALAEAKRRGVPIFVEAWAPW